MQTEMERLLAIMTRLRDRRHGCPWDREQTFATVAPYTIEEAYEVADAIDRGDMPALAAELGDLLFQVVFHAEMAKEQRHFEFTDVVRAIVNKMVERHPHVFGETRIDSAESQTRAWEELKSAERRRKGEGGGALDGIAGNLPAIQRAGKLQRRAAHVGFDWAEPAAVLEKLREELEELAHEIGGQGEELRVMEEIGDLMFTCVNLARHHGIDAESALRHANNKFERRFRRVEELAGRRGVALAEYDPSALDALWEQVKAEEG